MSDETAYPAHSVDCSANPYDLRPVVEGYVARIEDTCKNLCGRQPVIALMGEIHCFSEQILAQALILQALSRLKKLDGTPYTIAVGIEKRHNFLGWAIAKNEPPALQARISTDDHDGQRVLQTFLGSHYRPESAVAYHTLLNTCLDRKLSTRFIDVANQESLLDNRDPATKEIIATHAPYILEKSNINIRVIEGMRLRNIFIHQAIAQHSAAAKADIYVVLIGAAHIFGDKPDNDPYENSLDGLLTKNTQIVLPFMMFNQYYNGAYIPDAARERLRAAFIARGVSTADSTIKDKDDIGAAFAREERLLRHFLINSGNPGLTIFQQRHQDKSYTHAALALQEYVKNNMGQWIKEARTTISPTSPQDTPTMYSHPSPSC